MMFPVNIFLKKFANFRHFKAICSYSSSSTIKKENAPNLKSLLDDAASFKETDPESDKFLSPVYPAGKRKQAAEALRPDVDPQTTSVILFPGQGTQYVGMAKQLIEYPNVLQMFDCASEILRYNLLDLCINGPQDMLNMTEYCQVAVVVTSLAAVQKLQTINEKMINNCVATAGFSVGEYAALVFAGAITFEDAIQLLKIRGQAMQAASDMQPSGMMTVFLEHHAKLKLACASAREWCEKHSIENGECTIATHLFPHCKVVSGHIEALKYLELNGTQFGIRKIKYIPVSGAFHSKLMKPAVKVLEKALKVIPIETPKIPVHANVDGKPYTSVDSIQTKLANQLCNAVAWEQTMHAMFERDKGENFPHTYECGPGKTLKALLRFNNNVAYKSCENVEV